MKERSKLIEVFGEGFVDMSEIVPVLLDIECGILKCSGQFAGILGMYETPITVTQIQTNGEQA